MTNTPLEILQLGGKLLEPLLLSHGFTFRVTATGPSSGGQYAAGEFQRGARRLELHFRYSLGNVTYHIGELSMAHGEYMRSVLGRHYESHYPGFSSDSLDGFRHLLLDLEEYCDEFLSGTDDALRDRIKHALTGGRDDPKLPD